MINTAQFGDLLRSYGYDFCTGVPCSFLKGLINDALNQTDYIIAPNEGEAVAIASGAWLGGRKPVVLLQNSGLGNAVNPLSSLNYVFRIPVLGFVSLRGEPGQKDEPQHVLMGQITTGMLDLLRIRWEFLDPDITTAAGQLARADAAVAERESFFFVVRRKTFTDVPLAPRVQVVQPRSVPGVADDVGPRPSRVLVLRTVLEYAGDAVIIATTGYTGRELYELGDRKQNFYMVGSMGCASSLGLGLALAQPRRRVIVLDGDGAALMRLGALTTLGCCAPANLLHLVLDNGCYESTGAQQTVSASVDFAGVAAACGYPLAESLPSLSSFSEFVRIWMNNSAPQLALGRIRIAVGAAVGLSRPTLSPPDVAERLRGSAGVSSE
ncbi:MAG: phosphonopyruvate decarboxylase [Lentisphaerae bacterium RIFOXYB12_FULL_65_16]|nr:MAG: phosphonopyruvate decarboxylase [Lentisphaerae bacterium RIFOXYA12_64_32]OGV87230.1 MAG: phosphonopyruvate decarboxylase [Lentisphaerae bacterium RIFOXYB12_FULL_65_16]